MPQASASPGSDGARPDEEGIQLQALLGILSRRRNTFVAAFVAVFVTTAAVTVTRRIVSPVFEGTFSLLISDPVNEAGNRGTPEGGAISSVARNISQVDVPTLIRVLQSPAVLEPVYAQLRREHPDRGLPSVNISLVSAGGSPGNQILASGVLAVTSRGADPDLVRKTLQLSEKTYLDWALRQRREKLSEGVRFLDRQAPLLRARSAELQGELERFRLKHSVLVPQEDAQAVRTQVETLRTRLLEQQSERDRLQGLRADVAAGRLTARSFNSTSGSSAGTGDDGLSLTLANQSELDALARLDGEIATAQATYRAGAPMLQDLIASRNRLLPELQRRELQAVDAALNQSDGAIAGTKSQIERLEGRFGDQPALLRRYEDLRGRLEIADGNLANYQRTREQFQLEIAQNNVPWKVITPASVNSEPVEPQLGRGLLQALLFGLLAGGAAALLHDRLDHVFHSPGAVRDDLKIPLLGHIPYISFFEGVRRDRRFLLDELDSGGGVGSGGGGMASYQRFSYQEAFRNLYTSLRFLSSDRQVRSVVLSSSVPGEGKSLAIVLLAKTLSELGQRVLLVDADLRKPQLHHRLGLNNLEGLSNLLTQEDRAWREVVQTLPDHPNWDVITAGQRPPDPPRLLSSRRLAELVRDIADTGGYDLVLYDTPPALGLADAALLAEHLDGIMLLVSLNKVDRRLPAEALQRIQSAGAPILGVVTNSLSLRQDGQELPYSGERYGYDSNPYNPALAYAYYQLGSAERPTRQSPRQWFGSLRRRLNR